MESGMILKQSMPEVRQLLPCIKAIGWSGRQDDAVSPKEYG